MVARFINKCDYPEPSTARKVLDGARASKHAELAHLTDLLFTRIRDFFEKIEYSPSK